MGENVCSICKKKIKNENRFSINFRDCTLCKRVFCKKCSKKYFRYSKSKQNVCEECWEKNNKWIKN